MNDTDIGIILALAQGHLSGQAKTDALAYVRANSELSAELASQIAALDALQSVGSPSMTDSERTVLRSNLIEELHLDAAPLIPSLRKRRTSFWQPVIGLASAAALVLAILVVPGMLSSGQDEATFQLAARDQGSQSGESGTDLDESTLTSVAAAESIESLDNFDTEDGSFGSALADEDVLNVYEIAKEDLPELLDIVVTERSSQERSDEKLARFRSSAVTPIDLAALNSCLDQLFETLPDAELTPLAVTTGQQGRIVHLGVDEGTGIDRLISVDLGTCSIVGTTP